jgi:hypothetical protein
VEFSLTEQEYRELSAAAARSGLARGAYAAGAALSAARGLASPHPAESCHYEPTYVPSLEARHAVAEVVELMVRADERRRMREAGSSQEPSMAGGSGGTHQGDRGVIL